jgi:hypothetical protein
MALGSGGAPAPLLIRAMTLPPLLRGGYPALPEKIANRFSDARAEIERRDHRWIPACAGMTIRGQMTEITGLSPARMS